MKRFTLKNTLLAALVAIGGLSLFAPSKAEAGHFRRFCTPSYSYCSTTIYSPVTTYCAPTYVRTYSYAPVCNYDYSYSNYYAPTVYAPVTLYRPANCYGYGGYGYGGYGYGGCYYGGYGCITPVAYGQCGW